MKFQEVMVIYCDTEPRGRDVAGEWEMSEVGVKSRSKFETRDCAVNNLLSLLAWFAEARR